MIATRMLQQEDIVRGAQINDAIAQEYEHTGEGAAVVGRQLGIDVMGTAVVGAQHAARRIPRKVTRADSVEATTHAFTMGALAALRAVEVVGR